MGNNPEHGEYIDAAQPLKRFFNDCENSSSYVDLLMAVSKYLKDQFKNGETVESLEEKAHASGFIMDEVMYEFDPRQAIEQFKLLPLRIASNYADNHIEGINLKIWYTWAAVVGTTIRDEQAIHDRHCLDSTAETAYMGCVHSINCPMREVKKLLLRDLISPNFSSFEYQVYDERHLKIIAGYKISAAINASLLTRSEANEYFDSYETLLTSQNI